MVRVTGMLGNTLYYIIEYSYYGMLNNAGNNSSVLQYQYLFLPELLSVKFSDPGRFLVWPYTKGAIIAP